MGLYLTAEGGEITFGDYITEKVQGGDQNMIWVNNLEQSSWSFELSQAKLGGFDIFHHAFVQAVIHPGTPLIGFMTDDF